MTYPGNYSPQHGYGQPYGQQYGQPGPQYGQPQYGPQGGGYGPQGGQPMPPQAPAQRWQGGAAFDAQQQNFEKRPSVSFKNAPPGTARLLVCDLDAVVIHGTNYATKQPDYDSKGNPKWTVGTGFIDEYGQKVTHWCGKYSRAAIAYTSARTAVGLGPEDSMRGWVAYIQFLGMVQTNTGEARDYAITLYTLEQAMQQGWLSGATLQTLQQEGISASEAPGNLKCATTQVQAQPQQMQIPQASVHTPPNQFPQATMPGPVHTPSPMPSPMPGPTGQPIMQPGPGVPGPQGYGAAPGQAYGTPQGMPGPMGPGAQPGPQNGAQPFMQPGMPQPGQPMQPDQQLQQAVNTVQQTFPGAQQVQPQAKPDSVGGYRIDALAAYAAMPDAVLAQTGQDVNGVRQAIEYARQQGLLPQAGGQQGQPAGPPF